MQHRTDLAFSEGSQMQEYVLNISNSIKWSSKPGKMSQGWLKSELWGLGWPIVPVCPRLSQFKHWKFHTHRKLLSSEKTVTLGHHSDYPLGGDSDWEGSQGNLQRGLSGNGEWNQVTRRRLPVCVHVWNSPCWAPKTKAPALYSMHWHVLSAVF